MISGKELAFAMMACFVAGFFGGYVISGENHTCEAAYDDIEHGPPWSIAEIQRWAGVEIDEQLGPLTTLKYKERYEREQFNKYGIENYLGETKDE